MIENIMSQNRRIEYRIYINTVSYKTYVFITLTIDGAKYH